MRGHLSISTATHSPLQEQVELHRRMYLQAQAPNILIMGAIAVIGYHVAVLITHGSTGPLYWTLYGLQLVGFIVAAIAIRREWFDAKWFGPVFAGFFVFGACIALVDLRLGWNAGIDSLVIRLLVFGAVIGDWTSFIVALGLTVPLATWMVFANADPGARDHFSSIVVAAIFGAVLLRGHRHTLRVVAEAHLDLARRASMDPGTGLLTRHGLAEAYPVLRGQALRHGEPVFAVFVDVAGLKHVNDTAGHLVGDHLLRSVAEALRLRSREGDLTCRWGGDEFLWVGTGARPDAQAVRDRIVATMDATIFDHIWEPHLWVGVADAPVAPPDPADLINAADLHMLERRASEGRTRYSRIPKSPPAAHSA